jgi:2-dehydro-3-deoxyphosphogluconate aldolase/(4S)-4-hydroxy-2-oxoglutarate aldolase
VSASVRVPLPEALLRQRVIAVARRVDPARARALVPALRAGGVDVVEVTVEGADGIAAIEAVADSGAVVGAGSVATLDQARAAVAAGARFLVSPHTDLEVLAWCGEHGVAYVPGGLTPTELARAWAEGASAVKVFPASVVGPSFVAAVLAPLPHLALVPTGGIGVDDARAYLDAGAIAIGAGGWLTAAPDLDVVADRARALRSACGRAPV